MLVTLEPFKLAVICTVPGVLALTVMGALVWPAGTVTLLGTNAIPGAVLLSATVVSVCCAALIVTVSVPVAPTVMVSGLGVRAVGTGLGLPIVVPNRACRLVASKYRRSPTALLWPAHLVLSGLVPIRVETFSDRASVVPLNGAGANEP